MPCKKERQLQLQNLGYIVQNAGFNKQRKHRGMREDQVAVAIIMAESCGGDPQAYNPIGRDNSYGLFQINMLGQMGPDRRAQFGLSSNEQLFDPDTNARVAYGIFKDRGFKFTDWSTYNSGSYVKHLGIAKAAVENPKGPPYKTAEGDILDALEHAPGLVGSGAKAINTTEDAVKAVAEFVSFLSDSKNWYRVALFVGGGAIITFATLLWVKESDVLQGAVKAATNVMPAGRVANAVKKVT